jgi:hypothetical protein
MVFLNEKWIAAAAHSGCRESLDSHYYVYNFNNITYFSIMAAGTNSH